MFSAVANGSVKPEYQELAVSRTNEAYRRYLQQSGDASKAASRALEYCSVMFGPPVARLVANDAQFWGRGKVTVIHAGDRRGELDSVYSDDDEAIDVRQLDTAHVSLVSKANSLYIDDEDSGTFEAATRALEYIERKYGREVATRVGRDGRFMGRQALIEQAFRGEPREDAPVPQFAFRPVNQRNSESNCSTMVLGAVAVVGFVLVLWGVLQNA